MKKPHKTLLTRILQGGISRQQLLQRSEFFSAILVQSGSESIVNYSSDIALASQGDTLTPGQVKSLEHNAFSVYDSEKVAIVTIVKP